MKKNIYMGILILFYFIIGGYIWFMADVNIGLKFALFIILIFSVAPLKRLLKRHN
ncbi:hypothetical protein [Bacillus cereus]|uniref:Uncharacterized protein n=1 Tax=Bacillus cereus VD184 TaxID=1053242 RepID=A0A9W5R0G2_BACCE|nr:hypothetical protein [Bacillus cereus]EOQ01273.1 hypothetical protein IKC_06531 [Bacillus cereus VD184]